MVGILKNNIKSFKAYFPYVEVMLDAMKKECECTDGGITEEGKELFFQKDGRKYRVCSRNQENETELLIRGIDFEKDNLIIVFGIGNQKLLKRLLEKATDDTRIAVFEPNPQMFQYALKHFDLTELIESEKVAFFSGSREIFEKYLNIIFSNWINLVLNIVVISLPNYFLYAEYREKCIESVSGNFKRMFANMGNSLEDTLIGIDNQYVNVDYCMESNSFDEIRGKYEGYPAIIVSAGPSLDKNIAQLKKAAGKALIITTDASYRACMANGVQPEMIASIERGLPTYQYYYEKQEFSKEMVLISPSVLRPEIFEKMPGKKIIMAKSVIGVEGWWSRQFDSIKYCDMGHTCASVAFMVAHTAGCSPIILMGQDLAYTDDKIHGSMAHTEYEGENKKEASIEDDWARDFEGNPIRTCKTYNIFRYYFEEQITGKGIKVVDATEGGAYIAGSTIMTLEEAIDTYCQKTLPYKPDELLEERVITTEDRIAKYRQIKKASEDYIEELRQIQEKVLEFREGIIQYKDYDFEKATEEELTNVVEVMTENNQVLTYLYNEHPDTLSYYMQNIKQTIINVKNIGNKLTGENVKRNWELQVNLLEMIHIASSVVIEKFNKIVEFMSQKEEDAKCLNG